MSVNDDFLQQTAHRPWPLPDGPWIMAQSWHDLLFAHWPIPIEVMRALIPPQLELDTYDGTAWVGVVPFRMSGVRPRFVPSVPWLSNFLEFNIRTYVRAPNAGDPAAGDPAAESKPGVYFFSLDAANPVAVAIARAAFLLPYFNANMKLETRADESLYYESHRTHRGAASADFVGTYGPTGPVYQAQAGTLEHWLTERYCLYSIGRKGQLFRGDIHHMPWPLQPAFAQIETNSMATASGIDLPDTEPILHFAKRLDVVVWPITQA